MLSTVCLIQIAQKKQPPLCNWPPSGTWCGSGCDRFAGAQGELRSYTDCLFPPKPVCNAAYCIAVAVGIPAASIRCFIIALTMHGWQLLLVILHTMQVVKLRHLADTLLTSLTATWT
jgi:hypothetical protein